MLFIILWLLSEPINFSENNVEVIPDPYENIKNLSFYLRIGRFNKTDIKHRYKDPV